MEPQILPPPNDDSSAHVTLSSANEAAIAVGVAAPGLEDAWFDATVPSSPRSSVPPSGPISVGEFLGDPLADSWLR